MVVLIGATIFFTIFAPLNKLIAKKLCSEVIHAAS